MAFREGTGILRERTLSQALLPGPCPNFVMQVRTSFLFRFSPPFLIAIVFRKWVLKNPYRKGI